MKILFLITSFDVGGAPVQVFRMCRYLAAHDHDIILVSMISPESDELVNGLKELGVKYRSLGMSRGKARLKDYFELVKILRREKPDVINSHMVHANYLARFARPFAGKCRVINTIHGEEEFLGRRKLVYRLTDIFADRTVCVGKVLKQQAMELKAAPVRKLKTIYNGIDTESYRRNDEARKRLRQEYSSRISGGIDDETFVWITVGRYEKVKNQAYLIREFGKLASRYENTCLFLVGYGEEETMLAEVIKQENLSGKVVLTGKRMDVPDFLSMADAFVLSSIHEGLPLTLLEAAASGLPLVATDVGGCREIVIDGRNGSLCASEGESSLYSAMNNIMSMTPEARKKMGIQSRKLVKARYDIDATMDRWASLFSNEVK